MTNFLLIIWVFAFTTNPIPATIHYPTNMITGTNWLGQPLNFEGKILSTNRLSNSEIHHIEQANSLMMPFPVLWP